jgi:purine-binding chemotaxis protein CheW
VVDQRRRFEMPAREPSADRRLVVVRTDRHRAGLIVDSVSEVLRCGARALKPAPNLAGDALALVRSVINLESAGRMVLLLDPSELLSRTERGLLDTFTRDMRGKKTRRE